MEKKYHILEGGNRRADKDFIQWLGILKHFREKGIKCLRITSLEEAIKQEKLLDLYKEYFSLADEIENMEIKNGGDYDRVDFILKRLVESTINDINKGVNQDE